MEETAGKSEVAHLMRQIDLELEAAERGLYGIAITARHAFINARMQTGGERILRLIEDGKHEEAQALMNTANWGIEGIQEDKETTHNGITKGIEEDKTGKKKDETKTGE